MSDSNVHGENLNRPLTGDEINFWMRWGKDQVAIEDAIIKLESFGLENIRFLDGEWPDGRQGYQVVALITEDQKIVTSPPFENPLEALHQMMLWLHQRISQKQLKLPGQDAGGILGPDGMPLQ